MNITYVLYLYIKVQQLVFLLTEQSVSTGRARYLVTIVSAMTIKKQVCPGALRKAMTSTKE